MASFGRFGTLRFGVLLGAALLASGCNSIVNHRGFIADETLVRAIQPGLDNRQSVEATLGRPSFISQFGEPVWYYVSTTTNQRPFTTPRIQEQMVLAIRFDAAGNVLTADRSGMEQVARISPDGSQTPTLGRERSFLQDLFGNIGQVGAGAAPGS